MNLICEKEASFNWDYFLALESERRVLRAEEEVFLFRKLESENEQEVELARELLVRFNKGLVWYVAKQYFGKSNCLSGEDLFQIGQIGLLIAIKKFEWWRRNKFYTYAIWWIRREIGEEVRKSVSLIHFSSQNILLIGQYVRAAAELEKKLKRIPKVSEIANEMALHEAQVRLIKSMLSIRVMLESDLIQGVEESDIWKTIEDENANNPFESASREIRRKKILSSMAKILTEKESYVISSYYGFFGREKTLKEIGDEFGVSREYMRQVHNRAVIKLRSGAAFFEGFLLI